MSITEVLAKSVLPIILQLCLQLRATLEQDNTSKWGYVIYRCTYDDDGAWNQMVDRMRTTVQTRLEGKNAPDLLENFVFDIREDRSKLDGATIERVREHFQDWAIEHACAESPDFEGGIAYKKDTPEEIVIPRSPRYRSCVLIDEASLKSITAFFSKDDDMAG